jgi:hypothetical protein
MKWMEEFKEFHDKCASLKSFKLKDIMKISGYSKIRTMKFLMVLRYIGLLSVRVKGKAVIYDFNFINRVGDREVKTFKWI